MAFTKPRKNVMGVADTTAELASLGGRPGYKVLVKDNAIFEWTPTGPADAEQIFAGLTGFWSSVLKSDTYA